jgi:hypothetical protein
VQCINLKKLARDALLVGFIPLYISGAAQHRPFNGLSGGLTAATNGVGGEINALLAPTTLVKNQEITLSFQSIKHSRETKVQNTRYVNPKPYVYGKLNAAAIMRLSYSVSKQIGKDRTSKPSVFWGFSAGPSLGILKPYYIGYQSNAPESNSPALIPQSTETLANQDSIYGPATWTLGTDELSFKPGLHFATYLSINWNHSFYFQSWESGVRFDYFPGELEILHLANNKAFVSIYTSYIIGKHRL